MAKQVVLDVTHWPKDALWQRQKGETDEAWMAFFTYLGMHPSERTMDQAYAEFTGRPGAQSPPGWDRYAREFRWQARVLEYERWRKGREVMEEEKKQREENARWEAVRQQERERGLKIGQALLDKAQAMLQFPLAEVERVTAVYDDGREKEVQIFRPAGWNFGTVARMIEVGSKLTQLMAQMATEHHKIDLSLIYDEADKVAKELGGDLTREDVLAMADRIVREREERLEEEGRV